MTAVHLDTKMYDQGNTGPWTEVTPVHHEHVGLTPLFPLEQEKEG